MSFKVFITLLAMLLFASPVNAAAIHGTIYDLALKKVSNVRVEIDTSPWQFVIAQNGTYSFDVPNGYYTIKAELLRKDSVIASTQENITVKQDGSYVLDLILFPNIQEGIEDLNVNIDDNLIGTEKKGFTSVSVILLVLLIIILIVLAYYFKTRRNKQKSAAENKVEEKPGDDDLESMIKIIKQEGGRTTQKDIRKQVPLSEAKISLMIAELEHKGVIEKIKKGRGNIIILKKK